MHRSTLTRYIPSEFKREVHAIEGLPVCSACSREFKQWKGLRGHLLSGACPCPPRLRETTEAATSPQGPVQQQIQQLNARLKASPSSGLGDIAKDPALELLHSRCIICGFWTMDFKKIKSHIRQAHPQEWGRVHQQVEKLCAGYSAQLVKGLNCPFCRRKVHDRRKHPEQCVVLYQVCLGWVRARDCPPNPTTTTAVKQPLSGTLSIKEHFGDTVRVEKRSARDRQVSGSGRCTPAPPPTTADEFSVRTFSNTSNSCHANAVVTSLCVLHARGRGALTVASRMPRNFTWISLLQTLETCRPCPGKVALKDRLIRHIGDSLPSSFQFLLEAPVSVISALPGMNRPCLEDSYWHRPCWPASSVDGITPRRMNRRWR